MPSTRPLVEFFVPGNPKPQPRPRARAIPLNNGKHTATVYGGKGDADWRALVSMAGREAMGQRAPFDGALELHLAFVFIRPKSISRHKRPYPNVKPDCTNLGKSVEDALNGILFTDDARIVCLNVVKEYGPCPGVSVELWGLP